MISGASHFCDIASRCRIDHLQAAIHDWLLLGRLQAHDRNLPEPYSRWLPVYNSPTKPLDAFDFNTFWERSEYADRKYVDEALTAATLADIGSAPGFKLPASDVELANFPLLRLASEL